MRSGQLLLSAAIACAGAACSRGPVVKVHWAGVDTASVALPARAAWCAPDGPLVLMAVSNDTAVGVAVYPAGALAAGRFAVTAAGTPPPRGAVALRWPGKSSMNDFTATAGDVTLDRVGPAVSGRLSVQATAPGVVGVLRLTGTFGRVPVAAGGADCGGRPGLD